MFLKLFSLRTLCLFVLPEIIVEEAARDRASFQSPDEVIFEDGHWNLNPSVNSPNTSYFPPLFSPLSFTPQYFHFPNTSDSFPSTLSLPHYLSLRTLPTTHFVVFVWRQCGRLWCFPAYTNQHVVNVTIDYNVVEVVFISLRSFVYKMTFNKIRLVKILITPC